MRARRAMAAETGLARIRPLGAATQDGKGTG